MVSSFRVRIYLASIICLASVGGERFDLSLDVFERTMHSLAQQIYAGDHSSLEDSKRFTLEKIGSPGVEASRVVCVESPHGSDFFSELTAEFGHQKVDILSNHRSDGSCFIVHASESNLEELLSRGLCKDSSCFVSVLPAPLKISPGLVNFVQLNAADSNAGSHIELNRSNPKKMTYLQYRGLSINLSPEKKGKNHEEQRNKPASGILITVPTKSNDRRRLKDSAEADSIIQGWKNKWSNLSTHDDLRSLSWHSDPTSNGGHRSKPGINRLLSEQIETVEDLMEHLFHMTEIDSDDIGNIGDVANTSNVADACRWNNVPILQIGHNTILIKASNVLTGNAKDDTACMLGLISFLSTQPEIQYITPWHRLEVSNSIAASIAQSGMEFDQEWKSSHPLWQRGLTGRNQTAGVADTGLDDASCFFRDDVNGPTKRIKARLYDGEVDNSQRKVIVYLTDLRGDKWDYYRGHGTHVTGTIVGSRNSVEGNLPNCGNETLQTCTGECLSDEDCSSLGLLSPCTRNVDDMYFNRLFNCPAYNCDNNYTYAPGTYVFPDFCGEDTEGLLADAEGVASEAKVAFFDIGYMDYINEVSMYYVLETLEMAGAYVSCHSYGVYNDGFYDTYASEVDQFLAGSEMSLAIMPAGNDGDFGPFSIQSPGTSKNALTVGSSGSSITRFGPGPEYVSISSGRGPTDDRRIKPDVVAPGETVLSAAGRGRGPSWNEEYGAESCAVTYMSGTSMAAPLVTGHVLLVREYFENGMYADDIKSMGLCEENSVYKCLPFTPTGALLKSLVIGGAVHLDKTTFDREEEVDEVIHGTYEGFGRMQLDTVLPLGDANGPLLFAYEGNVTSSNSIVVMADLVPERLNEGLKVTISWMDYAPSQLSSSLLINDLELTVLVFYDGEIETTSSYGWNGIGYYGSRSHYTSYPTTSPYSTYSPMSYGGPRSWYIPSSSSTPFSSSSFFSDIIPDLPFRTYIGNVRTIGMRAFDVTPEMMSYYRDNVNTVEQIELTGEDIADAVEISIVVSINTYITTLTKFGLVMTGAAKATDIKSPPHVNM